MIVIDISEFVLNVLLFSISMFLLGISALIIPIAFNMIKDNIRRKKCQ